MTSLVEPFSNAPLITTDQDLSSHLVQMLATTSPDTWEGHGTGMALAFGEVVEGLRRHRGLSRVELATQAKINPLYLVLLERGLIESSNVPPLVVTNLASALHCPLDQWPLLPWSGQSRNLIVIDPEVLGGRAHPAGGLKTLVATLLTTLTEALAISPSDGVLVGRLHDALDLGCELYEVPQDLRQRVAMAQKAAGILITFALPRDMIVDIVIATIFAEPWAAVAGDESSSDKHKRNLARRRTQILEHWGGACTRWRARCWLSAGRVQG